MNKTKRRLLSAVSIVLAVIMCVSLVPINALAAQKSNTPVAANSPDSKHSYVAVTDEEAKAPSSDYSEGFLYAYTNAHGANSLFDGAVSYDLNSNTLTLKDFNGAQRTFEICNMGDDFKISLSGTSTISSLEAFGYEGDCSITICGTGTLNVKDYGISLYGNGCEAALTIDKYVTLNASYKGSKAISVNSTTAEKPVVFKGKEKNGGKAGRIRMQKAELPWHYNKELKSPYYVFFNPNKPYSSYSDFENTVYFGINEPILRTTTRTTDNAEHEALQFTLMALEEDENGDLIIKTTLTQKLIWDDDPRFPELKENYRNVTYDMVDSDYELVDTYHLTDEWSIVDNNNDALDSVSIYPSDAVIEDLPEVLTAKLENGVTGRRYSAQLEAKPSNGGEITSYKLSGSATDWLTVDEKGALSGKPEKAGNYNLNVVAVETLGEKKWESASVSIYIKVSDPNNRVKFENALNDSYYHKLVARKKSDKSVVKTLNLKSGKISKNTVYSLGELPAGEYEVELVGEATGCVVSYKNSKADLTVEENSLNIVSISPSDPSVAPNESSIMVRFTDKAKIEKFGSLFVVAELENSKENSSCYYDGEKDYVVLPDVLKDGGKVSMVYAYFYDMFDDIEIVSKDNPSRDGNTYTLDIDSESFTKYTVSGIPDEFGSVFLSNGKREVAVKDGGNYVARTFTEDTTPTLSNFYFAEKGLDTLVSEKPEFTVQGDKLVFSVKQIKRSFAVSGKVTNEDGEPIEGARVSVSQDFHYYSTSFMTVTDKDGEYKAEGLIDGVPAEIEVSSDKYFGSRKTVKKSGEKTDFTLEKQSAVTLTITDGEVKNATIKWSLGGPQLSGVRGSRFTLPVSVLNGNCEITLTSDDTVGEAKTTVTVKDGSAEAELTPVRMGTVSWYEPDADKNPVNDYNGYYVHVNGSTFLAGQINSVDLPEGSYTVTITKGVWDTSPIITQKLTVEAGKTVYVTEKLPEGAESLGTSSAYFTGPDKAMIGEQYRINGTINSIDAKHVTALKLECRNLKNSSFEKVDYATVNGTRVNIDNNVIYRRDNKDADWSLPLDITLYCKQAATKATVAQTVSVLIKTGDDPDEKINDLSNATRAGSVTTFYSPSISLEVSDKVAGFEVTDEKGIKSYTPNPVFFYGKTAGYTEVRLYDNDVLCAVTKSNAAGVYKGNFTFADSEVLHEIRAESVIEGETAVATASCTYTPDQAVIKDIYMGKNSSWADAERLPRKGESNYSYRTVDNNSFVFFVRFDNENMLDDNTYTIDGKEVTGKVFFKIRTTRNKTYILPAEKDDRGYKTDKLKLSGELVKSINVLFSSKQADHSSKITYDGEEYEVERSLKRVNSEKTSDGSYSNGTNYVSWMKELYKAYLKEHPSDKEKTPTGKESSSDKEDTSTKSEEEDDTPLTNDQAHEVMTWVMNKGNGPGNYNSISAEQAAGKCPEDKYILRSYTDAQPWTYTKQNFKLRQQELGYKGYVCSTYTDESTGHTMFMFTGSFYYDHYAMPVPSKTIKKVYSGIKKTEEDPRLYHSDKMVGSQLDVTYCFDATTKRWFRLQTATISPGAKSPIHTAASQIPCRTDAPYSYTPANVFSINDSRIKTSASTSSKKKSGDGNKWSGIDFSIDFGKVSAKTWTSGAISIGGAAYSKFASNTFVTNTCKIPKDAPINIQKWGWSNPIALNKLDVIDESLMHYVKGSKSMFTVGVTRESIGGAAVTFALNKINDSTHKSNGSANDGLDYLEKQLRDNMRYWGNIKSVAKATSDDSNGGSLGNYSIDVYAADRMIKRTRKVADRLTDIQKAVEDAQTQDSFTKSCTDSLGWVSMVSSLIPEYGTLAALTFDSVSFLLSAANDTRNEKVQQAVMTFIQEYAEYLEADKEEKEYIKQDEELRKRHQNMGANIKTRKQVAAGMGGNLEDPIGGEEPAGADVTVNNVHDPSGIVYEAVLSNPVKDAEVTLYNYESDEKMLNVWDDSDYLGQDNPVHTDSKGYYRWDVPEGEWFVIAKKDGYEQGTSNSDAEAKVKHGDRNYLPVLPPQLNVNIPLVSLKAPEVRDVKVKTDGVYITFTKYMDEGGLVPENFSLTDYNGKEIAFTLEKLDSEKAPSNIVYDGETPSYTSTVKLGCELVADDEVTLRVDGALKSYAGVSMENPYGDIFKVEGKTKLKAPEFSLKEGKVKRYTSLKLTCEDGADIIYTTDGTLPTTTNGKKAQSEVEITLLEDVTVRAIAVKTGFETSDAVQAEYSIMTSSEERGVCTVPETEETEPPATEPAPTTQPTWTYYSEPTEPTQAPTENLTTEPTASSTEATEPASTEVTEPASTEATEPNEPTVKPQPSGKKENPIKVTVKKKSVKLKKLKKKAQKVKAITVKKAQGKVSFKLVKKGISKKIRKLIKLSSKGVITIKRWKKPKKGTYKIKIKITAKGNDKYKSKTVTKTVKIKIK